MRRSKTGAFCCLGAVIVLSAVSATSAETEPDTSRHLDPIDSLPVLDANMNETLDAI